MTPDAAKTLAIDALTWMAADEDMLVGFMGVSGSSVSDIRERSDDPEFLGFMLDYILSDDAFVERFADQTTHKAEDVFVARTALPGGAQFHWT
jgi:hypothetical protein